MDRGLGFEEGPLEVGLVVGFAVVMGDGARWIAWAELADVAEGTINQRKHVLRGSRIEQPPVAANGDVHRRRVGHDPARPRVKVAYRLVVAGSANPGGEPGVAVDRQSGLQTQASRAVRVLGRRDDLASLH